MPFSVLIAVALQAAQPSPITVVARLWAPFISPMGEPFRSQAAGDDTLANWFAQADRNRDGSLTPDEMRADAERFFSVLDTDNDGAIGPEEIRVYEWELASEIQVNSQWRRARGERRPTNPGGEAGNRFDPHALQGAARYGLLNMPQPVAAADADFNRAITLAEFRTAAADRFRLLDKAGVGRLRLADLQMFRPVRPKPGHRSKPPKNGRDTRLGTPIPIGN